MSKKQCHTVLLIGDIICIWGLWFGYQEIVDVLTGLHGHIDTIRLGSRVGLFTTAAMLPMIHTLTVVQHLFPAVIKKYSKFFNISIIIVLFLLIISGFHISSWLKSRVENGGYIYCRNASGAGALTRVLIYTKSMEICEELVASKRKRRR